MTNFRIERSFTMPYLKINQDASKPTFEELELPDDATAWLHACYDVLQCRTIATAPTVLRGILLVVDDEAKLWDGWQHRINNVASILYGSYCDCIVGDAILSRVNGENLVPLTADDIERLKRCF